jgi:hypothetical protein
VRPLSPPAETVCLRHSQGGAQARCQIRPFVTNERTAPTRG